MMNYILNLHANITDVFCDSVPCDIMLQEHLTAVTAVFRYINSDHLGYHITHKDG
jgi:hypothetical protein